MLKRYPINLYIETTHVGAVEEDRHFATLNLCVDAPAGRKNASVSLPPATTETEAIEGALKLLVVAIADPTWWKTERSG